MKAVSAIREKRIQRPAGPAQSSPRAGAVQDALAPLPRLSDRQNSWMKTAPDEKPLRSASFVVHVTRGVIRDQNTRRKAMLALLVMALLLLLAGSTFLAPALNPREHLGWSLFFWLTCVWLTLTALLLALFDLLVTRIQARKAGRALREKFSPGLSPNSPSGSDRE